MPSGFAAFSDSEYLNRLQRTRQAMTAQNIDVLVVTDPSNMAWLTGYDGWSFYVHQAVIIQHNADPIWWGRLQDAAGAKRTVYMEVDHIIGYAESYIQSTTSHPMQDLAMQLVNLGYGGACIGVEMENYYYSAKAHDVLNHSLTNAKLTDATALVNWQRAIKSEAEIQFMRKAAKITDKIMTTAIERVQPGIRKNELVADIVHAGITGDGDDWGDYPAIVPLLPSGQDAAASHLTWDGREIQSGEATFFELSGCYRRYHAPLSRTVFLGKPPQHIQDAAQALSDGLNAGLEMAKPGALCSDIAHALQNELTKLGIDRRGARCGYPIGLSYPPDWGERTYSLRPDDETVLQAGMTFHFMPGLWMEDWGLETTETILITPMGAEPLCQIERKLFVKD